MTENDIAKEIVDAAYHLHKRLGPGLLESVYESMGYNVKILVPLRLCVR